MTTAANTKTANYSDAQVEFLNKYVGSGADGRLTFADCEKIAALPEMKDTDGNARKPRGIVAKVTRDMPERYEKKVAARKDGSAVETKAKIVAQIAERVGVALDGMEVAPREKLVALRDYPELLYSREAA